MPKPSSRIVELAKRGAEVRLRELVQEARYLIQLFPHLRDAIDSDELPVRFIISSGSRRAASTAEGPRKRRLSAAARKAISNAQKKRWAATRKTAKA